ncbi:E3 ubiquitin ligase RBR family [Trema orientale]|uniref:RBR-type E3 ubiquitin transferase n=1 Tax=Trema orientale TaxID=63057 RepID=A0A2P5AEY4_TREOI|nr:E3 ubiquitin ligase RBR family [Trema orientale]
MAEVSGRWPVRQRKVVILVNQIKSLQGKFVFCNSRHVPRNDIKFAFKLAKDAIQSQINRTAESSRIKDLNETCVICMEDTDVSQIFSAKVCLHRYCFSCMKQHVEVKLREAQIPKCPHEGCKTELDIDSCENFLTPKLLELMSQRIKEAATPVTERVYCPNPRCSFLMSKTEVLEYSKKEQIDVDRLGARKCVKCNSLFCVDCRVPWHRNMSCANYKRLHPNPSLEDAKLKVLASRNMWRQCRKCNLMIELAQGCYHMTCRCGYEFCYNCEAEWKNKKATCSCPLWAEANIWYDGNREFDEEEEEEDEGVEFYNSDSDY